jgi:hypothetical protein
MISVLEFMELADRNVETYKIGLQHLEEGKKAMACISTECDGMGLADRQEKERVEENIENADKFPLRKPLSRRGSGRPSNKRKKAGSEVGSRIKGKRKNEGTNGNCSKRPRFYTLCRSDKHIRNKCPDRDKTQDKPRKGPTCSGCGVEGHSIDKCGADQQQLAAIALKLF